MLTQFRIRYPKGSLISELVEIAHGKYVVRALVQVEGITLATGLAAAETVEQAEDIARSRALALVDLNSAPSTQADSTDRQNEPRVPTFPSIPTQSDVLATEKVEIESKKMFPQTPVVGESSDFLPVSEAKSLQEEELPPQDNKSKNLPSSLVNSENDRGFERPPSEKKDSSQSRSKKNSGAKINSSQTLLVETSASWQEPKLSEKTINLVQQEIETFVLEEQLSFEEAETTEIEETVILEPNSSLETTSKEEPQLNSVSDATIDFSEIVHQSDIQMRRLGWTREQGRDYLLQTYGKRSRQLLSDEELLEFLHYLESQPTPPNKI